MFEKLLENLFVLYSPDPNSNCYLLTGEKNMLIDTGLRENAGLIESSLKEKSLAPEDVDLILHTHGHCDHFGADYIFPEAEIAMHNFDAEYVNFKDEIFTVSNLFGNDYYPKINSFLKDGQIIQIKPFSLEVIETPGHTKGGVSFYDREKKLLFSGDTLFKAGFGRFDLVSSSKYDLIQSLAKLAEPEYDMLLPGHGLVLKEKQRENIKKALEVLQ